MFAILNNPIIAAVTVFAIFGATVQHLGIVDLFAIVARLV